MPPELHSLYLKLCSKQYNIFILLHLIVVPQISSGWQHNYSTKTRQAGHTNEQFRYSLMAVVLVNNGWYGKSISWLSYLLKGWEFISNIYIRVKNSKQDKTWTEFSILEVSPCMEHIIYIKLPNLKLKTWPKQLLGYKR